MSVLSPVRTSTFYSGTIAVADGYSGDKDVALSPAVDPNKVMALIPLQITAVFGASPLSYAKASTGNMGFTSALVASSTIFRFRGVANQAGNGPQTLTYAFQLVESR